MKICTLKRFRSLTKRPVISIVLLAGFVCVQFHTLFHVGEYVNPCGDHSHQSRSLFSETAEYQLPEHDVAVDCTNCVLTEHVQGSFEQEIALLINNRSGFIAAGTANFAFEPAAFSFYLRAPPQKHLA